MTRTFVSTAVIAAVALGGVLGGAFGSEKSIGTLPAPCTEGTFIVDGAPLLPAATTGGEDAVVLHDGNVSIASGCPAVAAVIRATPFGTSIRARWAKCGDVAEGVRLFAFVRPSCQRMLGYLSAERPSIRRRFAAAQCNDPASCRDFCKRNEDCGAGEFCAKRAGHCDLRGVCRDRPTACTDEVDPVCGCDGATYSNRCDAAAAGVNVAHRGRCRPTCGTIAGIGCLDGQFCELPPGMCQTADLGGVCENVPDACPLVIEPVCGCDSVTYGNDCERMKAKVQRAHRGACAGPSTVR